MKTCYITMGDWSEDGHDEWSVYSYEASHSIRAQRAALLKTEELTGLKLTRYDGHDNPSTICNDYEDRTITAFQIEMLRRYANGDNHHVCDCGPRGCFPDIGELAMFVLNFIEVSLPGFTFKNLERIEGLRASRHSHGESVAAKERRKQFDDWFSETEGQRLNGWWSPSPSSVLNHGFGYGIGGSLRSSFSRGRRGSPPDLFPDPKWYEPEHATKAFHLQKREAVNRNWRLIQEAPYELQMQYMQPTWSSTVDPIWKWILEMSKTEFVGRSYRIYDRVFFDNKRDFYMTKMFVGDEAKVRISKRIEDERGY